MRRVVLVLSLISVVALLGAAAPSSAKSAATGLSFTLTGSVPGGLVTTQGFMPVTFIFTATNRGSVSAIEDISVTKVTGGQLQQQGCVGTTGFEIGPDGGFCEVGFVKPGQSSHAILQVVALSGSTRVTARACLVNESTGVVGPCVTTSVASVG